ncbi:MAG: hypothetical protein Q4C09_07845 [Atopobiaceae bacterium]|nr:hypothetical protein [Atopobiaceae bacterium]
MRRPICFNTLRGLGQAMVVDIAADALCALLTLVSLIPAIDESPLDLAYVLSYLQWTAQVVGVASWAVALVSLTRLATSGLAFARARTWYVVRIIVFAASTVVDSPVTIQLDGLIAGSLDITQILLGLLSCLLGLVVLPLLPSLTTRETLEGCALTLESCGVLEQARANRRAAKRFIAASIASIVSLDSSLALIILPAATLFAELRASSLDLLAAWSLALLGAALLVLALQIVRLVTWSRATACVLRTCNTLENLAS